MKFLFFILSIIPFQSILSQYDSTVTLDAVHVEAYQVSRQLKSIPGSLSVLTDENLAIHDRTGLNSLNTLPGVVMQSGTFTTNRIMIRGMGSRTPYNTNRIRTYINDIPLTTADGLSSPEEFDITGIGRMEIIKGPSSALYGSGLGGSINLYTPQVKENYLKASIQYGSYHTIKPALSAGFASDNTTIWSALSHLHSDGYRQNSRYDRTSMMLTATRRMPDWNIDLLLFLIRVNSGIPSSVGITLLREDPQAAAPNWNAIKGFKKYTRGVAGITLTGRLSEKTTEKFSVFIRGIDSYERRPFNNLDDYSVSAGIRNKISLHTSKSDFVFGTEWILEQYAWSLDTTGFLINNNRESRSQLNIFGISYYRLADDLNITLAGALNYVRYRLKDNFLQNGDQEGKRTFPLIFSPRFGLNYSPGSHWAFYLSAGHGFSLPSPEETLLPAGDVNHEIRHEDGWQAEVGARLSMAGGRLGIDATLYWIELDNLLVTKRITEDIFTGINAGKTRHQGFEILFQGTIINLNDFPGKINAFVSYTTSINRFRDFTDDGNVYDGKNLPGIPDQTLYFRLTWQPLKDLNIIYDSRYFGDQYLNDLNTLDYSGYFTGNLKVSAERSLKNQNRVNIYAGIQNLWNKAYASMLIVNATGFNASEPRYYYPGLPRNFYAGLEFIF